MKRYLLIATLCLAVPAYGQQAASDHSGHSPAPAKAKAQSALADGEVRKVDRDAKKITLRHGPIPSLDMPPMTMVYQVKDPVLLDRVKVDAEKVGSNYAITRIESAK